MSKIKKVNPKTEAKDIRVGISFFINHPTAGQKVIDYSTDLERFRSTHKHVNLTPENTMAFKIKMHQILMDLLIKKAPIDEYFFTIGMCYLVTFNTVGLALNSKKFQNYGFMIEPIYNDYDAAMVGIIDYDSWYKGLITRKAA